MRKALFVVFIILIVMTLCVSCKETEHASVVDNNGETLEITSKYDSKGSLRYQKTVYTESNKTLEAKYDSSEKLVSKKLEYSDGVRIEEVFDSNGNLISNKFINTDGHKNTYEYEYDSNGNIKVDDYFKDLV